MEGATVSEFMRRASLDRAERTLAGSTHERLADVLGAIHGGGGATRDSGARLADLLAKRHKRR